MRRRTIIAALVCVLAACSSSRPRAHTSSWSYEGRDEVRASMRTLLEQIDHLGPLLERTEIDRAANKEISSRLRAMNTAILPVRAQITRNQQGVLDGNVAAFMANLELAISEVQERPPRYDSATSVVASCGYCHAP